MNNNVNKKSIILYSIAGISVLLILIVPIFINNQYVQSILFLTLINAALASSWNIIGGYGGQFSVGHSLFFGIGAYSVALFFNRLHYSPWAGIIAGACVAMVVSLTLGRVLLRLKSHFFTLATIATLIVFKSLGTYFKDFTGGAVGISIPFIPGLKNLSFTSAKSYIYVAFILLIIVVFSSFFIKNSKLGFYLQSIREDEDAARALGVNIQYYKSIGLGISAIFTSLGGSILVLYAGHVTPTFAFSLGRSIDWVLFSVVGGVGTVIGPIIGTFITVPIIELLRGFLGGKVVGLDYIIYGIILIVIILKMPSGIVGLKIFKNLNFRSDNIKRIKASTHEEKLINRKKESISFNRTSQFATKKELSSPILEVVDVSKSFGGIKAVQNITFEIKRGSVFGLIGPNGAGKSTLFNLLDGFYRPDSGRIFLNGKIISNMTPYEICKAGIGRTFQSVKLLKNLTSLENIMVGAFLNCNSSNLAMQKSLKVLELLGLLEKRNSLASNLDIFSQRKLEIGKALAGDPKLLILDEIMAGLNPAETEETLSFLKNIVTHGITLLIIEHKMKAIMSISDRVLVVDGEKIFEGTPKEVCEHEDVIEVYLGEKGKLQT